MRLDRKRLLLFVVVLLFFARLISVSSQRAIHSVLTTNLEAPARAQKGEVLRSLAVGLREGNEGILADYLRGCLGSLGATYAAALGEDGAVLAGESVSDLGRAPGEVSPAWRRGVSTPSARESVVGGRPVLELALPGARGGLLLGFALEDILRAERRIAMKIFLFTGAAGSLTLALLAMVMREQARREEQLRQSDKLSAVGRLAAGIAHEINNPLGSILGFAQAAAARLKPDDALTPALEAIEEEALRCRNLVQSLLTFSRQSKDLLSDEFELAPAVEGTLAMLEALVRTQGVMIVREMEDGLRAVGDRGQIQQVVMNLCTNAVDAMPEGGRLTLRSGRLANGRIFFDVEDEGTGVPEALRGKIFDPFFTTKDVGKGTGLGLSLVHEILVRHQGTIEAFFPARGARFRITLAASARA